MAGFKPRPSDGGAKRQRQSGDWRSREVRRNVWVFLTRGCERKCVAQQKAKLNLVVRSALK
jgi:hypothetical protein